MLLTGRLSFGLAPDVLPNARFPALLQPVMSLEAVMFACCPEQTWSLCYSPPINTPAQTHPHGKKHMTRKPCPPWPSVAPTEYDDADAFAHQLSGDQSAVRQSISEFKKKKISPDVIVWNTPPPKDRRLC